ncbi:MAG TPA: type IV pili methyl-accepting chemotaxis transducer N-terminal domain-containing protein [Flavobacterium sp.]
MKKILFLLTIFSATSLFAQTLTLGQAINMAGKQRMLSQRMAKDKIYKTMNKLTKEVDNELISSITLFDQNLKLLFAFAPTKEIKYKLEIVDLMWADYKKNLLERSRTATSYIFDRNTSMLNSCDNVVKELIAYSETLPKATSTKAYDNTVLSTTISNSGKLRYLTQRLTLYYSSTYYKVNKDGTAEIKEAIDMFEKTLTSVNVSVLNNSDTEFKISEIYRVWNNLKSNMYKNDVIVIDRNQDSMDPVDVYQKANEILNNADQLTNLYSMLNMNS